MFKLKSHEESTVSFALEDLITRSFRTKKPEQKIVVEEPIRLEELTKDEPTQSETISRISDHVHAEDIAIEISLDDRYKGRVFKFFSRKDLEMSMLLKQVQISLILRNPKKVHHTKYLADSIANSIYTDEGTVSVDRISHTSENSADLESVSRMTN